MSLTTPIFLLALVPAAAVLALGLLRRSGRKPSTLALALRALAALALGLAAAGLAVRTGGRPGALVILDRSASMAPTAEANADAALACGRLLSNRFDVRYASMAADTRLESAEGLRALAPDNSGSDVRAAMRFASGVLRDNEPAIIITDGNFDPPRDAAAGTGPKARPQFVFMPAGPKGPDAALVELDAPAEVRPGEKFAVVARVAGSAAAPVTVELRGPDGAALGSEILRLPETGRAARSCTFEVLAPASGLLEYSATLSAKGDAFAGNNTARALVRVLGKLKVAVVSRGASAAAVLLGGQDVEVATLAPEKCAADGALSGFDAVILENLPRSALSPAAAGHLADFVRSGGGLVMLGGPDSYGAGRWEDGGALERELPASMRPPDQKLFVVLVLDRSGSMGRPAAVGSEESKLSLVKRAAQDLLGAFRPGDRLAVVAFSERAELAAGPAEPADGKSAAALTKAIGDLSAGTSTHMADALAEAKKVLPPAGESGGAKLVRHVILLSDGLPEGIADRAAEARRIEELSRQLAASGVTISTVGTGGDDQDRELLRKVAVEWGRGEAYQPKDLATLESVFRADLARLGELTATGTFRAQAAGDPLAASLGGLPEFMGRNRVSAKPRARTVLEAPPAAGRGREPLLVVWDRGRGRAACLASSVGGEWGPPAGGEFLKAVVGWAAGRSGEAGARLSLSRERTGWKLELTARREKDKPAKNIATFAEVSDRNERWSARVELLQESPSKYDAQIAVPADVTELHAVARETASGRELARAAFPLPFPEELGRIGVNAPAIDDLAQLAGGRVVASPAALTQLDFPGAVGRSMALVAPWLAAMGVFFVLCELALRALRK